MVHYFGKHFAEQNKPVNEAYRNACLNKAQDKLLWVSAFCVIWYNTFFTINFKLRWHCTKCNYNSVLPIWLEHHYTNIFRSNSQEMIRPMVKNHVKLWDKWIVYTMQYMTNWLWALEMYNYKYILRDYQ